METQQRHCWECRRRCLVCDFTEPACKRCSTAGVECPGYGHVKPQTLKWLTPGRVTSRSRKRKGSRSPSSPVENDPSKANSFTTEQPQMIAAFNIPIPRFELKTDVCSLPEAAEYFNSCIYRELAPIQELGKSPHIYQLSVMHIQRAANKPDYLNFGMLCMTLSHRINRTRNDPQSKGLAEKFYSYWGLAIRSLNAQLDVQERQTSDLVMAGIMTLLLADVQQGTSLNWRCHLEGIHRLISLRGGFHAVASSPSLEPLLLSLWFVAVIGNTTCPVSNLIMTKLYFDSLELLLEKYGTVVSPIHMCPLPLFAEIIKINHLRMRAISCYSALLGDLSTEGLEILERIHLFSPEQWASSKPFHQEDWVLIGKAYKAAAALYCILSLQSLGILPDTPDLRACCAAHGQILWLLLDVGLSCPRTRRSLIWPLVLLGVEAVHGGPKMRAFVSEKLPELSYDAGTYVPLMAKSVLKSFWDSGEMLWDSCFDRPYVFTSQIAVDTSRLSSD
ncbi:hypothetical protein LCI18_014709 [Fusarium solani-melongenae]|uniref:Uncharacterized protein n=1 Tax=Fusarium solani subsp. cucurbitae TaxID=2747967 RepID=A0ACD3ZR48_FUSSC|nr:hypothetical protein LCI18_014709 [Fusarium solani-melongenae]